MLFDEDDRGGQEIRHEKRADVGEETTYQPPRLPHV